MITLSRDQWMPDREALSSCGSHTHALNWTNSSPRQVVNSRNRVSRPGKMKAKAYSQSHIPRNWAATTKAGAAIEPTLPDQLWATFVRIRITLFLQPIRFLAEALFPCAVSTTILFGRRSHEGGNLVGLPLVHHVLQELSTQVICPRWYQRWGGRGGGSWGLVGQGGERFRWFDYCLSSWRHELAWGQGDSVGFSHSSSPGHSALGPCHSAVHSFGLSLHLTTAKNGSIKLNRYKLFKLLFQIAALCYLR